MITLITLLIITFHAIVAVFVAAAYVVAGFIGLLLSCFGLLDTSSTENVRREKPSKKRGFSEEEILALGLYPDDEAYKMSLISNILNK